MEYQIVLVLLMLLIGAGITATVILVKAINNIHNGLCTIDREMIYVKYMLHILCESTKKPEHIKEKKQCKNNN